MKDLKCGLTTCKHNKGYCCCSKEIEVDKGTDCTTYEQDENKHVSMFEAGDDFVKADYSVDTRVSCEADCVFNKSGKCVSNGITVMNEGENGAVCLTYIKQ